MLENLKYIGKLIGLLLLAGIVMTVGIRAGEWFIPAPETRVVVCLAKDIGEIEVCEVLEQLKKKPY